MTILTAKMKYTWLLLFVVGCCCDLVEMAGEAGIRTLAERFRSAWHAKTLQADGVRSKVINIQADYSSSDTT